MSNVEHQKSGSQKPTKADDPLQMQADCVAGDQRVMMSCLIEEFAHMGWDATQIERMFENPFFLASHGLKKHFGSEVVRECIEQALPRCGVFKITVSTPPQSIKIKKTDITKKRD